MEGKIDRWYVKIGGVGVMWEVRTGRLLNDHILKVMSYKVWAFYPCSRQFWLHQTNEINLAQHFSSNFSIQFVYLESFW